MHLTHLLSLILINNYISFPAACALAIREDVQKYIMDTLKLKPSYEIVEFSDNFHNSISIMYNAKSERSGLNVIRNVLGIKSILEWCSYSEDCIEIIIALCKHSHYYRDDVINLGGIRMATSIWNSEYAVERKILDEKIIEEEKEGNRTPKSRRPTLQGTVSFP